MTEGGTLKSYETLLKSLVDVTSGTADRAGVKKVQEIVEHELRRRGFKTRYAGNAAGKVLIGQFPGERKRWITLVTHADTVFETHGGFVRYRRGRAGTAVGPGVIDDKGSIVVALAGVEKFLARRRRPLPYGLQFVCSPSEETGSVGLLPTLRAAARASDMVLGFEPSLDRGEIIHSRQGGRWYEVEVLGKEAHAGRAHRAGANAALELAIKIQALEALTAYAKEVTVNVGSVVAGDGKANVVCGHARAKVDTRFPDEKSGDALHRAIKKILVRRHVRGTRTTFRVTESCPALRRDPVSQPFLDRYCAIVSRIEKRRIVAKKSGGGADSSHLGRPGLVVIDGLGAVGGGAHTHAEWITLSSLETRSEALAQFLEFAQAEI